jgi:hypothetical protein
VALWLATYNVENLFARARALNADSFAEEKPTYLALRRNPRPFDDAWPLLRENKGEFLVAPDDAEGRSSWNGWIELIKEPVDEVATRMTAKVIGELGADLLCVVEAEDRPSLVRFNTELLGGRYGHGMLVDGNDPARHRRRPVHHRRHRRGVGAQQH